MIDRTRPLPITRQARIVNISRGSVYYAAQSVSDADLKLMRRIDELHLELPFAGARMLRDLLRAASRWTTRAAGATTCSSTGCGRSIEYEEVYLHAYETVSAACDGIGRYINFYNTRRPHSSHQPRTPEVVYFASLHQPSAQAA